MNNPHQASPTQQLQPIQKTQPVFVTVDKLTPSSHGHNLIVKVVSCSVVVEKTRTDGTKIKIAEAVVGDNTGCITFTARNKQIELVQPRNNIILRNSKIDMFKGFMRLAVDKWGKLELNTNAPDFGEVSTQNDLSGVEYELVTVPEDIPQ